MSLRAISLNLDPSHSMNSYCSADPLSRSLSPGDVSIIQVSIAIQIQDELSQFSYL